MVRSSPRWFVLLVVVLTLLGSLGPAAAQDATPPADAAGPPEGITVHTLASGTMEVLAPGTANLGFGRVSLDPGASVAFDPTDPSALLVFVASGAVTFQVETPMTVVRGARAGTPVPTEPEAIPAGTAFILNDGDSALFPPAIAGEARNDGTEAATAWVVTMAAFAAAAATPTP